MTDQSRFFERIETLGERADRHETRFSPPADPPAEDRAMAYLREGVGPAVSLFVEARTGGLMVHFPPEKYETLEGAMNTWLELYGACYGVDIDGDFQLRTAAELLVDTHNVRDVAQKLTHVPDEL
ncbi:hypothetical protein ACKVMT_04880 [Halobacteriales archaeon Cl-PHB]